MDAFYEEDERIVGHAADAYHRIDIRRTSRELIVRRSSIAENMTGVLTSGTVPIRAMRGIPLRIALFLRAAVIERDEAAFATAQRANDLG